MRCRAVYSHPGFDKISNHYYQEIIRRNPIMATWLGEHQYDALLPEVGAESIEKNLDFLREMRDTFNNIPDNELSIDERIDKEAVNHFVGQHLFIDGDLQRWKMGKDLAMNIGDAIFLIFSRDFAPLHTRVETIVTRLRAVPAYLMSGKTLFQNVPALWGEIFLESARNLPVFLDTIEKNLHGQVSPVLISEFYQAAQQAKKSLANFTSWFKNAIMPNATASWSMGEGAFQALLGSKQLGLTKAEILEIEQHSRQMADEKLEMLGNRIVGASTKSKAGVISEAHNRIRHKSPASFELALKAYRNAVSRSRDFVTSSGFATLPDNEDLEILETPEFMAHLIPFSAYIGPERASDKLKGTYLLTRDQTASRYNYAEIINNAIHEVYPGHHLQLSGHNLHPGKMRSLTECLEIIEGWAHYCEDATREMGFEVSDECLFTLAANNLFNCARLKIDVMLQTREWNFDQAIRHLMDQGRIDRPSALAEVRRYTQFPGSQISNITGKHILMDLKKILQQEFKNEFSDRNFHDLIIYEGSLPIHIARKYYGEKVKQIIKTRGSTQS